MRDDITAEVLQRLTRIETKHDAHAEAVNKSLDGMSTKLDSVDGRLRGVEVKSGTLGAIAGTIMSVGTSLVMAKLTGKA